MPNGDRWRPQHRSANIVARGAGGRWRPSAGTCPSNRAFFIRRADDHRSTGVRADAWTVSDSTLRRTESALPSSGRAYRSEDDCGFVRSSRQNVKSCAVFADGGWRRQAPWISGLRFGPGAALGAAPQGTVRADRDIALDSGGGLGYGLVDGGWWRRSRSAQRYVWRDWPEGEVSAANSISARPAASSCRTHVGLRIRDVPCRRQSCVSKEPDAKKRPAIAKVQGRHQRRANRQSPRRFVAERTELPITSVTSDQRLLSDLHLNSMTVALLVADISHGRWSVSIPPNGHALADATILELVEATPRR